MSGKHKGIIRYTLGQHTGLAINSADKLFVVAIDPENNTVTLGEEKDLYKSTCEVEQMKPDDDPEKTFYGLSMDGFQFVYDLNFKGTLLPTMVFTTDMIKAGKGNVLNISSMNAIRPLTKIPAYSAAKGSINNFTQWYAVHVAQCGIRCNAIAPGFFLTNQNRFLLTDEATGALKPRGEKIIANTPTHKFGEPEDIIGTMLYLLSDISSFVTGVVIPVDGGYSAFGGV